MLSNKSSEQLYLTVNIYNVWIVIGVHFLNEPADVSVDCSSLSNYFKPFITNCYKLLRMLTFFSVDKFFFFFFFIIYDMQLIEI